MACGVTAIAAGGFQSLFLMSDGSLWVMGWNRYGALGNGAAVPPNNTISWPEQILGGFLPGCNQISGQPLSGGKMQLSFVGITGTKYALDRCISLSANWFPQATNVAGSFGVLVFTNLRAATTNNFWRIRSVKYQ